MGTYIGDVNIGGGGGGAGSETDMAIWGLFKLWGGYVNIVGVRGPGAEFGDVNIWGVRVGVWDRYRVC